LEKTGTIDLSDLPPVCDWADHLRDHGSLERYHLTDEHVGLIRLALADIVGAEMRSFSYPAAASDCLVFQGASGTYTLYLDRSD
jgi:hypothetical protein